MTLYYTVGTVQAGQFAAAMAGSLSQTPARRWHSAPLDLERSDIRLTLNSSHARLLARQHRHLTLKHQVCVRLIFLYLGSCNNLGDLTQPLTFLLTHQIKH